MFARRRGLAVGLGVLLLLLAACGSTARVGSSSATAGDGGLDTIGTTGLTAPGSQADSGTTGSATSSLSPTGSGPTSSPVKGSSGAAGSDLARPALSAPGPGRPIQIGFFIFDNSRIATALGVGSNTIATPTVEREAAKAFVDAINARGGIAGHRLEPVFASIDATSNDYQSDYQAACQQLTQDNHVAVVISDGLHYGQVLNACLAKAGVAHLVLSGAGYSSGIGDATDLSQNPGLIGVNTVTADRRLASIMDKAVAAGFLHSGSKLGVFVEDCPYDERAYDRVLGPIAARHHISVTRVDSECVAQGLSQAGEQISIDQSAVLRFRSAGVDTVVFDSALEFDLFFYFSEQASSQRYTPQYLLFDSFGASGTSGTIPSDQVPGIRGFGGWPMIDVANPPTPPAAQADIRKTCYAEAARAGLKPVSLQDRMTVLDMCDGVRLMQAALTSTGGLGGLARMVSAVEALGTGFVSAIDLAGGTAFGSGRYDGQQLTAVSRYLSSCTCFAYVSSASPIG